MMNERALKGKFQKEKLSMLVMDAMYETGDADFAKAVGVSVNSLRSIINCEMPTPPSKTVLKNIARASGGQIDLLDLIDACGYDMMDEDDFVAEGMDCLDVYGVPAPEEEATRKSLAAFGRLIGEWEFIHDRYINRLALRRYINAFKGGDPQKKLAQKLGVPLSQVKHWMRVNGQSYPNYATATLFCEKLNDVEFDHDDFLLCAGFLPNGNALRVHPSKEALRLDDAGIDGEEGEGDLDNETEEDSDMETEVYRLPTTPVEMTQDYAAIAQVDEFKLTQAQLAIYRYMTRPGARPCHLEAEDSSEIVFRTDEGRQVSFDLQMLGMVGITDNEMYQCYGRAAMSAGEEGSMRYVAVTDEDSFRAFEEHPAPGLKTAMGAILIDKERAVKETGSAYQTSCG